MINLSRLKGTTEGYLKKPRQNSRGFVITLSLEHLRIVAYLDDLQAKVDSLKRLQAETAAKLAAMLPSVLDRAFKGEL